MGILPASLNYTDRDMASVRLRMYALIQSVFPAWSDENVANFGNLLIELYAWCSDLLGFYQDNQARESRLVTATQLKNVINLAKMLGYTALGGLAAQATETFTLAAVPANSVTLPAGTVVKTANVTGSVSFQLLAPVVFPANVPAVQTGVVENSTNRTDTFSSNGLPNQSFILSKSPFVDSRGGVPASVVTASNGTFTEVANFLAADSTDAVYTVAVDQNGVATITFGDGVNGLIPTGTITDDYITGGGSIGNVEAGTLNVIPGNFTDSMGNPVTVSATNAVKAEGGTDPQTVQQIQVAAPQSLRATTRSVANEDFVLHTLEVPGVARALMATSNEDPGIAENTGILYVVPQGGGVASPTLLAAVLTIVTVTYPCTLTFTPSARTASYYSIAVFVRAYKTKGTTGAQLGANVRSVLAAYFAITLANGTPNPLIDFGANYVDENGNTDPLFSLGLLFESVEQTSGVRELGGSPQDFLLNNAHADLVIPANAFPVLGVVTVIDGDTGLQV
jgi:hypothetical protein